MKRREIAKSPSMLDQTKPIAVLMGGPGSERDVSVASGKAVATALQKEGFEIVEVDVTDCEPEIPQGVQLAFNVIHGTFGEDGQLQDYLEKLGVPYTGARAASSRLAFDKLASKEKFIEAGVPTPRSEDLAPGELPSFSPPLVVKPPCEGSSVGVSIVNDVEELPAAIADAAKFGTRILVEEFVEGRELTVGVIDGEVCPIVEIIPPEDGWYDMATKYPWLSGKEGGSQYVCPAELDASVTQKVQEAALAAYRCLGIEVYARVDVLLNEAGEPFVLEVNTIPGMTETSLLPKSARAAGIEFGPLCARIAEISAGLF